MEHEPVILVARDLSEKDKIRSRFRNDKRRFLAALGMTRKRMRFLALLGMTKSG